MDSSDSDSDIEKSLSMDSDSFYWTDFALEEDASEDEEDERSWDSEWSEDEELEDWLLSLWDSGSSYSEFSSEDEDSLYLEELQEESWSLEDPEVLSAGSRLVNAVILNNLEEVREILNIPEQYKITGDFYNNLLQIAIRVDSREVFDYLLASGMASLEALNHKKQTTLMVSLTPNILNMFNENNEYYARELLNKTADVWGTCSKGNTLLHYAVGVGSAGIVKMLVEGGVNPNEPNVFGRTPFHMCFVSLSSPQGLSDIISILLSGGADPSISDAAGFTAFELAMRWQGAHQIQEMLFYRVLENYIIKMDISILLEAIDSPLFPYIIKWPGLEISDSRETIGEYITELFSLEPEHLKILMKKCSSVVKKILRNSEKYFANVFFEPIVLDNFDVLLESELRDELIELITSCKVPLSNFFGMRIREPLLIKMICYLLSYGLNLYGSNLQDIYLTYGYCDLLKICLHMDILEDKGIKEIMPVLIYNVNLDLQTCLKYSYKYSLRKLDRLLQHFAGQKLKDFCNKVGSRKIKAKAKKLPQIPTLQELARNTFRQTFIDTFHIETSRQFHTMVEKLPVCNLYKKMLTYEQPLY